MRLRLSAGRRETTRRVCADRGGATRGYPDASLLVFIPRWLEPTYESILIN